jgi:hypothetical protein
VAGQLSSRQRHAQPSGEAGKLLFGGIAEPGMLPGQFRGGGCGGGEAP